MTPITGSDLIKLIPQKPPFVFIGALHHVSETACVTSFVIDGKGILCDNGCLNPSGLIENMAQTCAAKAGYECALANLPIPFGFIGDIKDFTYTYLPVDGEEIFTEIKIESRIFNVTIIAAEISVKGESIAHAKMKIYSEQN